MRQRYKKDNDENLKKIKISSLRRVDWLDKPINFNKHRKVDIAQSVVKNVFLHLKTVCYVISERGHIEFH